MKFICLGFIDESYWLGLSEAEREASMAACFAYDDELRQGGHFLGGEALQPASHGVTLRPRNGRVDVTDGPFSETKEVLGGLLYLEARDLNHAIALMSAHPGARLGPFEIRPIDAEITAEVTARDQAFRAAQKNAT